MNWKTFLAFTLGIIAGAGYVYWQMRTNDLVITTRQCRVVGPDYAVRNGSWTCGN